MNGDEMSRGNQQNRRPSSPNRFDSKPSYSPSSNYNFNSSSPSSSYGNTGYGNQQGFKKFTRQDHKFKGGGGHHSSDKLVKQNDQIIKLLKEIRDRLPAPPAGTVSATDTDPLDQDSQNVSAEAHSEAAEQGGEGDETDDEIDDVDGNEIGDEQGFVAADEPETYDTEEK